MMGAKANNALRPASAGRFFCITKFLFRQNSFMKKNLAIILAFFKAIADKRPLPVSFGPEEDHGAFLAANEPSPETLALQRNAALPFMPRFLIRLFPGGSEQDIRETAASLAAQSYTNWSFAEALSEAHDLVIRLEAGDTLAPDALFRFAKAFCALPDADVFYADEDVRFSDGSRGKATCKGAFSPVTAMAYDLLGRPAAIKRKVYRSACEPLEHAEMPICAIEYACGLRISRCTKNIFHLPYILCTRKHAPRPVPFPAGSRALAAHMEKSGIKGSAAAGIYAGSFRPCPALPQKETTAIIIPNRDGADSLRRLLESIADLKGMDRCTFLIADGGSRDPRTLGYYAMLEKSGAARIIRAEEGSFAFLANRAAEKAEAETLLFLDRRAEAVMPGWLRAMREALALPGVGAVGCKLTDVGRHILSAGAVAGLCGWVGTPYAGEPDETADARKNMFINALRETTLLSGAVMMVKTAVFAGMGGFDETFRGAGADADLCLRLMRKGLVSVYTPFASLILHGELPDIAGACRDTRRRCYDTLRPLLAKGDPFFSLCYSYEAFVPVLSAEKKPPLACRRYDTE